jgi:hypothetical protein
MLERARASAGYGSLRIPALILYALFAAFAAASFVHILGLIFQVSVLQDAKSQPTTPALLERADNADAVVNGGVIIASIACLAIAGVFLWWTWRATRNVPALGAEAPEFSPAWAIGWWLIPFANLVQPGRVVRQAWRAADPRVPPGRSAAWRRMDGSSAILAWWIVWVLAGIASVLAWRADYGATLDDRIGEAITELLATVALVVAAGFAIAVVYRLTVRQDLAFVRRAEIGATERPD